MFIFISGNFRKLTKVIIFLLRYKIINYAILSTNNYIVFKNKKKISKDCVFYIFFNIRNKYKFLNYLYFIFNIKFFY